MAARAAIEAKKAPQSAPAPEPKQIITPKPIVAPVAPSESEESAKAFIYAKESGNNPAAINSSGCRGLGQACPGTKLTCGDDYACQDAWFTNYMKNRYGTWTKAKAFWLARVPINGKDVGHWW